MTDNAVPTSRYYESQGLRLHYADWGNETAPPLILVHGGRDHCRSWDFLARALRPHFHVLAPDLRGHGDSDWTRGGSYPLTDYVYDMTRLVQALAVPRVTLIGHSMGGMVSLIYSGSFPDRVSSLVVLDGVTVLPGGKGPPPPHERIARWVDQLDRLHDRAPHRLASIEEAALRMQAHNKRLSRELALHLATHGVRQNEDGSYSWKFDPYQRVSAPHRLWADDHVALWARITCPTLLVNASESFLAGPRAAGLADHFQQARVETISGAGHWLQHDKPDEVLGSIRSFLGVT
ncbi:alpha/beta hydrolase [Bradyrhizobium guangdongense]|uniref:alpha/beta fold hydrolase n=1 Tax=Bradyrhizobium guangdongense TaxID=1325090 RepID=UPI001128C21E|nr:alpha/beta hydrolase [Bradyrhizobium guangdongense]TPQ34088.1 alpha/beta hydrolase [Bradyrhizobium guangdongense]